MNTKTTNPDGKVHRHPEGGYYLQCSTLLDDKLAVVTFRIHKGTNGGSSEPYWVTTATIQPSLDAGPELPVYATPHGSLVVKNGFTKRQAADVYHHVRDGYVTRGDVAYRAKFAPEEAQSST